MDPLENSLLLALICACTSIPTIRFHPGLFSLNLKRDEAIGHVENLAGDGKVGQYGSLETVPRCDIKCITERYFRHLQGPQVCLTVPSGFPREKRRRPSDGWPPKKCLGKGVVSTRTQETDAPHGYTPSRAMVLPSTSWSHSG